MVRPIPQRFFTLIKQFESEVLRVYDDKHPLIVLKPGHPVDGKLTAGVGHTDPSLYIGMTVTKAMSDAWLESDAVHKAAIPLEERIGAVVQELTENQYTALLSFVFNLGPGPAKGSKAYTLWKRLRDRSWDQVPGEMIKFVNWDGERSEALYKRRVAEVAIWGEGEPGVRRDAVPSTVTQREATPPTPSDPVPVSRSSTVIATVGTAAAGAPVMINSIATQAEPYVKAASRAQEVFAPLSLVFSAFAAFPKPLLLVLGILALGLAGFSIYRVIRQKTLARN